MTVHFPSVLWLSWFGAWKAIGPVVPLQHSPEIYVRGDLLAKQRLMQVNLENDR